MGRPYLLHGKVAYGEEVASVEEVASCDTGLITGGGDINSIFEDCGSDCYPSETF